MKPLKLVPLLGLIAAPAFGMSFKAKIQPLKLPLSVGAAMPAPISNTKPGEMSVAMHRICGDGDVANFSKAHPTFEIVPNTLNKMDYVLGYWVEAPTGGDGVPTPSNFYALGYGKMDIAANSQEITPSGKFIPMNYSNKAGFNGMDLYGKEITELHQQAVRSMAVNYGADAKPIRIYAGVFTCMNMDDSSSLKDPAGMNANDYVPGHTEIGSFLSHQDGLAKAAETAALSDKMKLEETSAPQDNTLYKVDFGKPARPYDVSFGSGPDMNNAVADHFRTVSGLSYPSGLKDLYNPVDCETISPLPVPCDLVKTKEQRYAEFINPKIGSIGPGGSEADLCRRVGITVNGDYKWEFFKLNATCRYFLRNYYNPSQDYQGPWNDLKASGSYPSESAFNSARDRLARRLFVGAALEEAHRRIQADSAIKSKTALARPNCFNNGARPLIERLIGSYPIAMKHESGSYKVQSNPYNHVHPEPLFALMDEKIYLASNQWAVYGQVIQSSAAYSIPTGACIPTADGETYDPTMGPMYVDCATGAPYVAPAPPEPPMTPETLDPTKWSVLIPHGDATKMNEHKIDSNSIKADKIDIIFKIRALGDVPNCPWFC